MRVNLGLRHIHVKTISFLIGLTLVANILYYFPILILVGFLIGMYFMAYKLIKDIYED